METISTSALEAAAQEPIQPKARSEDSETLLESIAGIAAVLVMALFVMTFVFQNYQIPSGSMEKTLLIGDHVVVDRVLLAPRSPLSFFMPNREVRRGDIIVFFKPGEPNLFLVKRVIGVPGDHIRLHGGIVSLNGVRQDEPQAAMPDDSDPWHQFDLYRDNFPEFAADVFEGSTPEWAKEMPQHVQHGELIVPPGSYFAMGDNRINSLDSRYWGFVPRQNIIGRPLFNYWSFETPADQIRKQRPGQQMEFLAHIVRHLFDETRWRRTLHVIR
ncbi:MAG TPA: signal peptidase I [Granulicella sp.]